MVDYLEPTAYFDDVQKTGGIAVGDYIDYAWHGYNNPNEFLQVVDPWAEDKPYHSKNTGEQKSQDWITQDMDAFIGLHAIAKKVLTLNRNNGVKTTGRMLCSYFMTLSLLSSTVEVMVLLIFLGHS